MRGTYNNYNASARSRTDILRALHEMERTNRQPNNVRSTVATNNASLCLRIAAERGKTMEVKRFLAAGATVSNDSVSKNIPLRLIGHCFVFSSAFEFLCVLQNGLNALHKAAKWGHTSVVKQLLASRKFNVNMQDKVSGLLVLYLMDAYIDTLLLGTTAEIVISTHALTLWVILCTV